MLVGERELQVARRQPVQRAVEGREDVGLVVGVVEAGDHVDVGARRLADIAHAERVQRRAGQVVVGGRGVGVDPADDRAGRVAHGVDREVVAGGVDLPATALALDVSRLAGREVPAHVAFTPGEAAIEAQHRTDRLGVVGLLVRGHEVGEHLRQEQRGAGREHRVRGRQRRDRGGREERVGVREGDRAGAGRGRVEHGVALALRRLDALGLGVQQLAVQGQVVVEVEVPERVRRDALDAAADQRHQVRVAEAVAAGGERHAVQRAGAIRDHAAAGVELQLVAVEAGHQRQHRRRRVVDDAVLVEVPEARVDQFAHRRDAVVGTGVGGIGAGDARQRATRAGGVAERRRVRPFDVERDVAAVLGEVAAPGGARVLDLVVAAIGVAHLGVELQALEVPLQHVVDDTGDRVGAVDGRAAALHHLDAIQQAGRHDVGVDLRVAEAARRRDHAAPVDERQRPPGAETEQRRELLAAAARRAAAGGEVQGRVRRGQLVQRLRGTDEAAIGQQLLVDHHDRGRGVGGAAPDARAGDDDLLEFALGRGRGGFRRGLGIGRCAGGKDGRHHDRLADQDSKGLRHGNSAAVLYRRSRGGGSRGSPAGKSTESSGLILIDREGPASEGA